MNNNSNTVTLLCSSTIDNTVSSTVQYSCTYYIHIHNVDTHTAIL